MARIGLDNTDVTQRIIDDIIENTPIAPINNGSIGMALIDSFSSRLVEQIDGLNESVANANPLTATDKGLDTWGRLSTKQRVPASHAAVFEESRTIKFYVFTGTFGDINNGNDIVIKAGTKIFSDSPIPGQGNIIYTVDEDTTLSAADSSKYINASSLVSGAQSNIPEGILRKHDFTNYADFLSGTLLVINELPITNATSEEDDISFRRKVVDKLRGNDLSINDMRNIIVSYQNVSEVVVLDGVDGLGYLTFIVQGTSPITPSPVLDRIRNAIVSPFASYGITVGVRSPRYVGLSFVITIKHKADTSDDRKIAIESNISSAISEVVNNNRIGQSFSLERVRQALFAYLGNVESIGSKSDILTGVYYYRSEFGTRTPLIADNTISIDEDEKTVLEFTIDTPITFIRV